MLRPRPPAAEPVLTLTLITPPIKISTRIGAYHVKVLNSWLYYVGAQLSAAAAARDWSLPTHLRIAQVRELLGIAKAPSSAQYIFDYLVADPRNKVVIFCIHRSSLNMMRQYLWSFGARILYAGTGEAKRNRIVKDFQTKHDKQVLVCQSKVAGLDLTLTAAGLVFILEPSWIPEDNYKAITRVYRPGQRHHVTAVFAGLPDTADAEVSEALMHDAQMIADIFG